MLMDSVIRHANIVGLLKIGCLLLFFSLTRALQFEKEDVHTTEVFIKHIRPSLFGWENNGSDEFRFTVSLKDAPDLPSWIHYKFSPKLKTGFLYGVPPPGQGSVDLELIGINYTSYDPRYHGIHLSVLEKKDKAQFEVQMKINNLNIEDIMDAARLKSLLHIFESKLWPESHKSLYVTFIASAVDLGARLPLRPDESEGVVVRIGSEQEFSPALIDLELEVKPLWKLTFCDFKRTTVERFFRSNDFYLDWCAFRLNNLTSKADSESSSSSSLKVEEPLYNLEGLNMNSFPSRKFSSEFFMMLLSPVLAFLLFATILSLILCFHHHSLNDELSDEYFDNIFYTFERYFKRQHHSSPVVRNDYVPVHLGPTKRSVSPHGMNYNTLPATPRMSEERTGQRPQPPPYSTIRRNDL